MKAVVLEKTRGRCVVLKENGDFSEIRDRGYAVGEQIVLKRAFPGRALAACASFVMLLGLSAAGVSAVRTPVDFVYMDINPSLRLEINRFRRVIRIVPLNNDAENLLASHDIAGTDVPACMNEIVSVCIADGYINENNHDIEVHVSTGSDTLVRSVEETGAAIGSKGLDVETYDLADEDRALAEKMRVSAGWVRAARRYSEEFGGTAEENAAGLRGVTKEEMYLRVRAKKNSSETPVKKNRISAIRAYTEKFGGTEEENAELLEKYTVGEIRAMCGRNSPGSPAKTPGPKKKRPEAAGTETPVSTPEQSTAGPAAQPVTPEPAPEKTQPAAPRDPGKAPPQRAKEDSARERAIRRYTKRFGGLEEENALLLEGMTVEEILKFAEEAPKSTHTPKPEREKENGNAARGVTRKEAVRRYTEAFGGTDEKNNRLLKGLSVKDILQYIQSGTPYSPLP